MPKQIAKPVQADLVLYTEEDTGFENTSKDDFAIPFINLLQKLSPQLDPENGDYIEGAKAGQFYNTVSGKIFDEIEIVPCHYERSFLEWVPRDAGGGLAAVHTVAEGSALNIDDNFTLDNGNMLSDTRTHFVLVKSEDDFTPALISLKSTQIKKSKRLMQQMQEIKIPTQDGKRRTLNMYANYYKVTAVLERKNDNSWYGYKFSRLGQIDEVGLDDPGEVFALAKDFRTMITSGQAKVDHATATSTDEAVDF